MASSSQKLPRSWGSRSPEDKSEGQGPQESALVSRVASEPLLAGKKHVNKHTCEQFREFSWRAGQAIL